MSFEVSYVLLVGVPVVVIVRLLRCLWFVFAYVVPVRLFLLLFVIHVVVFCCSSVLSVFGLLVFVRLLFLGVVGS